MDDCARHEACSRGLLRRTGIRSLVTLYILVAPAVFLSLTKLQQVCLCPWLLEQLP